MKPLSEPFCVVEVIVVVIVAATVVIVIIVVVVMEVLNCQSNNQRHDCEPLVSLGPLQVTGG